MQASRAADAPAERAAAPAGDGSAAPPAAPSAYTDPVRQDARHPAISPTAATDQGLDAEYTGAAGDAVSPHAVRTPAQPVAAYSPSFESPGNSTTDMTRSPPYYDRSGQIGIGELATPRWLLASAGRAAPGSPLSPVRLSLIHI